jgi:hypothetical protein
MSTINETVPTPSTAFSSVKRERSASPAEEHPGRDAKRANLGAMTTETEDRKPIIEDAAERETPSEERAATEPTIEEPATSNGTEEREPINEEAAGSDGTERQGLQLTTETEGSAPRYVNCVILHHYTVALRFTQTQTNRESHSDLCQHGRCILAADTITRDPTSRPERVATSSGSCF